MLQEGFVVLRQALDSGCTDWAQAEAERLHNVPSLLGEMNLERHRYFWEQERGQYLDRISTRGSKEAKSRMRTYYEPILNELEHLIAQRIAAARSD